MFRHGQEHGAVFRRRQLVPSWRHDEQIARPPVPGRLPGDEPHPAA
jgi:hypothetical protein